MVLRILLQIKSANTKVRGKIGKRAPCPGRLGANTESNYTTRWTAGVWKVATTVSETGGFQCFRFNQNSWKGHFFKWDGGEMEKDYVYSVGLDGWYYNFPLGLKRVVKWRFNTSLQSGDLGSVPVLPVIPYDPRWLRLVCRNFSIWKVRLVKPFFSTFQRYGGERGSHIWKGWRLWVRGRSSFH